MKTFRPFASILAGLFVAAAVLLIVPVAHAQTASQLYAEGVDSLKAGDVAGAKKKLQLTLEVDKNFRPASALLARIALEEKQGTLKPAGVSAKSLDKMIVPVEFKDTTLQSALEFLRQRVETDSGGQVKINFVMNLPPGQENKKVTLQLNHVPVTETLRYIGNLAGVNFDIQRFAIVVTPVTAQMPTASPASVPGQTP